jgi:hypothetical protein
VPERGTAALGHAELLGRDTMPRHGHLVVREIIVDNEGAAQAAYQRGDYVACFLLMHSLIEALLRAFLGKAKRASFDDLIKAYEEFLNRENRASGTFVHELTQLNRRRNRVVHGLWGHGYTVTNRELAPACRAAFQVYGLFIEWLETFDPEITDLGFEYD